MLKEVKMTTKIRMQIAQLQEMSLEELKVNYLNFTGQNPPDCGRVFIRRLLAYKIQERHYGGLDEETKKELIRIGAMPKDRKNRAGIVIGTRFEREWKGKLYVVIAREDGFEMNGQMFKSLSGVAREITHTSWNGKKFFMVK